MIVNQAFSHQERHTFHLYLHVDCKGNNDLLSTIPKCLLDKYFPALMATIKYAYVPSALAGDRLLQRLANKILQRKELHDFFYPEYLLKNGRATFELAEQIINFQEMMHMYPRSYYSALTDKVRFFALSQTYLRKRRHILRTGSRISRSEFEFNYIFTKGMEQEFEAISKPNIQIELVEDGQVEYALVIDQDKQELLMFVCV